jgi:hypothetical protein
MVEIICDIGISLQVWQCATYLTDSSVMIGKMNTTPGILTYKSYFRV